MVIIVLLGSVLMQLFDGDGRWPPLLATIAALLLGCWGITECVLATMYGFHRHRAGDAPSLGAFDWVVLATLAQVMVGPTYLEILPDGEYVRYGYHIAAGLFALTVGIRRVFVRDRRGPPT